MSKETKISKLLKQASVIKDRKFARQVRSAILKEFIKQADFGILQNYQGGLANYDTREHKVVERAGQHEHEQLYGVKPPGYPENTDTDISTREYDRSLSTRYSPDRPGVQSRRISDGVFQDPYTGKVYDWNEGFRTETGEDFHGGGVTLQTKLYDRSSG